MSINLETKPKYKVGDHIKATGATWVWYGVIFEVNEASRYYRGIEDDTGQIGMVYESEIVELLQPITRQEEESVEENDDINHPSHYTAYKGIEVIQLTEQLNFNRGNAVKYIARAGLKNPDTELEDLKKAAWYVNREIARIEGA